MKINEIKPGFIFFIGHLPNAPKIKTEYGYIDIFSNKKFFVKNQDRFPYQVLRISREEIAKRTGIPVFKLKAKIKEIEEKNIKYLEESYKAGEYIGCNI